jgi:glutamate 5-kinase
MGLSPATMCALEKLNLLMSLKPKFKRVVVKIGSSLLTREGGHLDAQRMTRFVAELAGLRRAGVDVVLVTSGAIAAGTSELGWRHKPQGIGQKQAAAAVGQPRLMETYRQLFRKRGVRVGQLLLTREDFENRARVQNVQHTFTALLDEKVIPIINENDTVAVEEIRLGDNDTLAALVAIQVKAELLVILTDVDGLMTAHPKHAQGELIHRVERIGAQIEAIADGTSGSDRGTGGMQTKIGAAKRAMAHGVDMVIASGKTLNVLTDLVRGRSIGTLFSNKRHPPR